MDPLQSHLKNVDERERLAKVFDQGLNQIVGYALPLRHKAGQWESGFMFLRRDHCFLIPGDSPMGLRLPLDSIPWAAPADLPIIALPDPFAELLSLPKVDAAWRSYLRKRAKTNGAFPEKSSHTSVKPGPQESAGSIVRTTLCVEPRNGKLHVFMPPMETTEAYLKLLAAVEETARSLQLPVIVEGEPPPRDPRLDQFKITPDPGVIEVNVKPATSWDEMVTHTTVLYDEARITRLGTEKFRIDGRHTGTGGGNHIVLGAATPTDSPFLRRPDLLRSLLCFWQNHPSLSFLFSGLFIGPTSQHPRVDEARTDSLYELEIAFNQIPDKGEVPPWLVDRIFRHLLTDSTGNTHRTEFCIDKLYDPTSNSGRLGLLEMRAFEMPPHAEMSLTQALLLRALISRFWKKPYRQPLVRWGTQLHDRFMLPHFVEEDFRDVIEDLQHSGYPLLMEWFEPHLEFRFPKYGEITQRGIHLELRQALEPWHVLGEEGTTTGTVRYVDSSLERLQIKIRGLVGSRYSLSCNGCCVPLHPTGVEGEFVAGIRFRAWQPPECLHPTLGIQAPLIFDLIDLWNERSIGGCTYHVSHPGGLNYATLPVNSFEAESRRLSRFTPNGGHSPGLIPELKKIINQDFPFTLDLRMQ